MQDALIFVGIVVGLWAAMFAIARLYLRDYSDWKRSDPPILTEEEWQRRVDAIKAVQRRIDMWLTFALAVVAGAVLWMISTYLF